MIFRTSNTAFLLLNIICQQPGLPQRLISGCNIERDLTFLRSIHFMCASRLAFGHQARDEIYTQFLYMFLSLFADIFKQFGNCHEGVRHSLDSSTLEVDEMGLYVASSIRQLERFPSCPLSSTLCQCVGKRNCNVKCSC